MAVEDLKTSQGTVKTGLRENAVGLPGMLMQGIATIAPSFAILASFVFIVSFASVVTPWAYLFGGALLALQALNASQLAKVFPSAGGWYTWIARAFHPRAGFFAGVLFSVWLPPVGVLTLSYLAYTVLEPSIKAEYNVDIKWWIWVIAGMALVIFFAYQGIALSEKALIITGSIEILIMVALALSGLASTGPGGFSWAPLNPGNFHLAGNLFLGVVFSIFAFSGWESTGPMAEESKNPKRNVPIGLVGSVAVLTDTYFVFVTWGYLNGIGVAKAGGIADRDRLPGRHHGPAGVGRRLGAAAVRAAEHGRGAVHRPLQRRDPDLVRDGPVRRAAEDGRQGQPDPQDPGQRDHPPGRRAGHRVRLRADLGRRRTCSSPGPTRSPSAWC